MTTLDQFFQDLHHLNNTVDGVSEDDTAGMKYKNMVKSFKKDGFLKKYNSAELTQALITGGQKTWRIDEYYYNGYTGRNSLFSDICFEFCRQGFSPLVLEALREPSLYFSSPSWAACALGFNKYNLFLTKKNSLDPLIGSKDIIFCLSQCNNLDGVEFFDFFYNEPACLQFFIERALAENDEVSGETIIEKACDMALDSMPMDLHNISAMDFEVTKALSYAAPFSFFWHIIDNSCYRVDQESVSCSGDVERCYRVLFSQVTPDNFLDTEKHVGWCFADDEKCALLDRMLFCFPDDVISFLIEQKYMQVFPQSGALFSKRCLEDGLLLERAPRQASVKKL